MTKKINNKKINNMTLRQQLEQAEKQRAYWKSQLIARCDKRDSVPNNDPRDRLYRDRAIQANHHYEQWCMQCDALNAQIKQRQVAAQGTVVYGKK